MANVIISDAHLTDIADAIRSKNGTENAYKPREMAAAITAIEVGSGGDGECSGMHIPEEALSISGNCSYRFANGGWSWFIEEAGSKMKTAGITEAVFMFSNSNLLEEIPFDINVSDKAAINNMFANCYELKTIPYIKGTVGNMTYLFSSCNKLRNIPEDWSDYIDTSYVSGYNYGNIGCIFSNCYSLRRVPKSLLDKLGSSATKNATYHCYKSMFSSCYNLDEAKELPVVTGNMTANAFADFAHNCNRMKDFTFALAEDGTPYKVNWKTQTIDLSMAGFVSSFWNRTYIINYNSGITAEKQVYDDATYAALKDDDDWFACDKSSNSVDTGYGIKYSRYNHDSAVNTINSLPDTSEYLASAGGTNTIKFKGAAGSNTDGGAINTLTEEEIAVAAAKGWTVTFA